VKTRRLHVYTAVTVICKLYRSAIAFYFIVVTSFVYKVKQTLTIDNRGIILRNYEEKLINTIKYISFYLEYAQIVQDGRTETITV
jgi:hypothetical protein